MARKPKNNTTAKLSPLLRSAFEVLNHGLHHYFRSNTTPDMKFCLLHIDQAIELILKEKVRAGGKSIYKPGGKETISIHRAYQILEDDLKVLIPEKADLELLHEERNNIQHKYANPSADDAAFHVDYAIKFLRRFVREQLDLNIEDFVSAEYLDDLA